MLKVLRLNVPRQSTLSHQFGITEPTIYYGGSHRSDETVNDFKPGIQNVLEDNVTFQDPSYNVEDWQLFTYVLGQTITALSCIDNIDFLDLSLKIRFLFLLLSEETFFHYRITKNIHTLINERISSGRRGHSC